ncbi:MAG: hypothetical protein ABH950_04995 [Candidatus Altiarchaeota archaeon]
MSFSESFDEVSRILKGGGGRGFGLLVALIFSDLLLFTVILTKYIYLRPGIEGGFISLMCFLLLSFGVGYSITRFVSKPSLSLESILIHTGFGLAGLPFFFVVFNSSGLPLHIGLFLVVFLSIPFSDIFRYRKDLIKFTEKTIDFSNQRKWIFELAAVFLSLILFFVFLKGSFSYPWLEDGDPWQHAVGAKYVSLEETYSIGADQYVSHYLEPYPPSYDVLMGLVHQTNNSINWTLKFFNSLLVSIGLVLFFFFARQLTKNDWVSFIATFVLLVIPSYMGHFIWAQSLALIIFFPAFIAIERIREDRRWMIPAAIMVASNMLVQPLANVIFGVFFALYFLVQIFVDRGFAKKLLVVGCLGLMLSLVYWVPTVAKFGWELEKINSVGKAFAQGDFKLAHWDKTYGVEDFLFVKIVGGIDQHVGVGLFLLPIFVVSILLVAYEAFFPPKKVSGWLKENYWLVFSFLWLVFTFLALEGNELTVSVMPYKFWPYFSIPLALITAKGISITPERFRKREILFYPVLFFLLVGVLFTSAYPKYYVSTSLWPAGTDWQSHEHLSGYFLLGFLPKNTVVYPACHPLGKIEEYDPVLIGVDFISYPWDDEVMDFRADFKEKSVDEIYTFLKGKGYQYIFLDGFCMGDLSRHEENKKFAAEFNAKLEELVNTEKDYFKPKIFGPDNTFMVLEILDQ